MMEKTLKIKSLQLIFFAAIILLASFVFSNKAEAACQVLDADFRSNANWPANAFTSAPNAQEQFNNPIVYVDIITDDCVGDTIDMSLTSYAGFHDSGQDAGHPYSNLQLPGNLNDVSIANNIEINVTEPNFTLVFRAGEENCIAIPGEFDCKYFISTWDSDSDFDGEWWDYTYSDSWTDDASLSYDCQSTYIFGAVCISVNWLYLGILPFSDNHPDDQFVVNVNDPNNSGPTIQNDAYLAPLPGLAGQPSGLKGFLQGLFNVMIIIAGIAAVIMIVIGAITYVSADALSGKENGRVMMLNAVLGLILALGAWVIINTINPDLAESLNITIPAVNFNPAFEPGLIPAGTSQVTLDIIGGGQEVMTSCDESKIGTIDAFGHTFKIHQGLVDDIHDIEQEWLNNGGSNWYEIRSIGGYVCRNIHGTNIPSAHSYGLAVDINPDENPFHHTLVTDMLDLDPPPPDFTALWTSRGWGWGGDWTTVKDAMHFSKFGNEGGDLQINPY